MSQKHDGSQITKTFPKTQCRFTKKEHFPKHNQTNFTKQNDFSQNMTFYKTTTRFTKHKKAFHKTFHKTPHTAKYILISSKKQKAGLQFPKKYKDEPQRY